MFIPTTKQEMEKLGWKSCDIILVTGDTYIDSPYFGVAIIGHLLLNAGFKVGIIAQPDLKNIKNNNIPDIMRLGAPELFWGVTGGCMDSMVSNYTPVGKPRRNDDLTPGGINNRRPDRAVIVYCNEIRKYFKNTVPIVIGGLEASLRRIAHYDYWDNKIRRSILFDSKADYLIYGMAEKSILEFAKILKEKKENFLFEIIKIKGLCYASKEKPQGYIEIPSYEEVKNDKDKFIKSFKIFYENNIPGKSKGLAQKHDTRYLIQNPPQDLLTTSELDKIYELDYEYDAHPYYKSIGKIKALDTIKFSITSHRGCFGECNFCAISVHQGNIIISRSKESIIREVEKMTKLPNFNGIIYDIGGPTANMYAMGCKKFINSHCLKNRCVFPVYCEQLNNSHQAQIELLKNLKNVKGIKKVFIGSGIRYDLVINDRKYGDLYLEELIENHVSGQLKIAPEHSEEHILKFMGKSGKKELLSFIKKYFDINKKKGKKQFLTYYFIAAHPGCTKKDMIKLKEFIKRELRFKP
ncbi:MAG: YgiQ family radical SAM protein, partial [Candidatus Goldbacteria bacterium]|nr:YgiQ family radical SAM protein [Candidatus Goldiibacteriota bacterium]